mgnify:CR=1 FL=1
MKGEEFMMDYKRFSVEDYNNILSLINDRDRVLYGENISDEKAQEAKSLIKSSIKKPLEINLVKGGQPIYHFIISVE